jgi:hypothetical protein
MVAASDIATHIREVFFFLLQQNREKFIEKIHAKA